jgi:hypothetical protein
VSKYKPLRAWLSKQSRASIPVTFQDVERIVGGPLPASKTSRAWWSNNPDNNVMTREWLAAGYETEQVDIAGERLVFRRRDATKRETLDQNASAGFGERAQQTYENEGAAMSEHEANVARGMKLLEELYGKVGGLVTLAPGFDPSEPWGEDVWPDPQWPGDWDESEEK